MTRQILSPEIYPPIPEIGEMMSDDRNSHVAEPFRSICNAMTPHVPGSPNLVSLAERAKISKAPVRTDDELFDCEKTFSFARIHLLNAIAGIKLCESQATFHIERDFYREAAQQLEDIYGDLNGTEEKVKAFAKSNAKAPEGV